MADDGHTLQVDVQEAKAISRAKELRSAGLSLRQIGRTLVAEGHSPRRATSWAPSVLRRVLMGVREPSSRHGRATSVHRVTKGDAQAA